MATHVETSLSFSHETYNDLLIKLQAVPNKCNYNTLKIIYTIIGELNTNILNGLTNILDLELSNCNLFAFQGGIFYDLINLRLINLSNNMISVLDDNLFILNNRLQVIILKNNLLQSINTSTFLILKHLEMLDLSYNHILVLGGHCLVCLNLTTLYLNNNEINNIMPTALHRLPNLTRLALNNNKIETLYQFVFEESVRLEYLYLHDNRISQIYYDCFWMLTELKSLYLRNNYITQAIDEYLFLRNNKIIEIDLFDNEIHRVEKRAFVGCHSLRYLNLKVTCHHDFNSLKHLQFLQNLEIYYKNENAFLIGSRFWDCFKNKSRLVYLKLIFQKVHNLKLCDFSELVSLECLHIEFVEPNDSSHEVQFSQNFNKMPKLQSLSLIKLNSFTVARCVLETPNVKTINLIGLNNEKFDDFFYGFNFLKYLNLSFCKIKVFTRHSFQYLTHLEQLIFEHSKLTHINSFFVNYNFQLKYLNCAHCCITLIDDYSFKNLSKLQILDLRHNFLMETSKNMYFGLSRKTCSIRL